MQKMVIGCDTSKAYGVEKIRIAVLIQLSGEARNIPQVLLCLMDEYCFRKCIIKYSHRDRGENVNHRTVAVTINMKYSGTR